MSTCANAVVPASAKAIANADVLTLDGISIHVNPSDVDEPAPAVAASRHEIRESDFIHSAQVRFLDPASGFRRLLALGMHGRDGVDVEPQPADRGDGKLRLDEVLRRAVAVRVIADEPRAVRELQHRPHDMKSRRTRLPADLRASREVDVVVFVAQRRRHRSVADPRPQIRRILPVVRGRRRNLDFLRRRSVQLELEIRIRQHVLVDVPLEARLFPGFGEEERRKLRLLSERREENPDKQHRRLPVDLGLLAFRPARHAMPRTFYAVLLACAAAICAVAGSRAADEGALSGTFTDWSRHPAISYSQTAHDPVSEVAQQMRDGTVVLQRDGTSGYLRSVLDVLHVPVESQIMIFNPDSVQGRRITATNPRSLFFNDRVAVGWVRGGFIELAAQDPSQGVVFYTLEQAFIGQPHFQRNDGCLTCHYSYGSAGVPGMLARSTQQFNVTHRLPIEKAWGGWYVTGNPRAAPHPGNIDLKRIFDDALPSNTLNWPSLQGKFDLDGYLSPYSDVVALMVFDHQMHMMNLLSRIGWEARVADYRRAKSEERLRADGDDPADTPVALD